jgi:thiol:disulfide interchange protein DsbC
MVDAKTPPRSMGECDASAIERNTELGRKHRITGTPTLLFEDGTRVPGALPADEVEKLIAAGKKP